MNEIVLEDGWNFITITSEMNGKSLYPMLKGQTVATRSDFFMEHVDIVEVENPIPDSRGVRSDEWKYIRYINVDPEVEELYNIRVDPRETNNLANDLKYVKIKNQLKERYNYYLSSWQK